MTAPFGVAHTCPVAPEPTAGNSRNTNVMVVPRDSVVSAVTYAPVTAITGAATNNRTVSLVNKGQDGTGTTVIATLNFANGTNAAASDERSIPLSGTPANLEVAAGDVLQWQSAAVGTGIADPGGLVAVTTAADYD
jgi:hypothetical protein